MSTTTEKTDFVTVVSVEAPQTSPNESEPFVTVLSIGSSKVEDDEPHVEIVNVYRLPGERLGFGLKFEGGTKSAECVRNLYIQSCAPESPASRVKASWGGLGEGDEIMAIGGKTVESMTRIDCVRALKDSPVVIELLVKRRQRCADKQSDKRLLEPPPPPPIPPRKISKRANKNGGVVVPPKDFVDKDDDKAKVSTKKLSSSPLVVQKNLAIKQRRSSNDSGSIPPEAEVYLNLIAQETEVQRTEYESDDTGSSISTIVDRLSSFPATSCSSISESSVPSTPILGAKEMDKVLSPFELLEKEFATRFDSDLKKINGLSTPGKLSDEMLMLQPPANFQDAPLSYGDEGLVEENNNKNGLDKSPPSYENISLNDKIKLEVKQEVTSSPPKPLPRNINSGVSRIPKRRAPPPPPPRNSKKNDGSEKKTKYNKIESWLQETDTNYITNGDDDDTVNHSQDDSLEEEEVTNIEDIEIKLEDDPDDEIEHLPRLIHFLPKISPQNTPIVEKPNPFDDDLDIDDDKIDNNNAIINLNNNTYNLNGLLETQQLKQANFSEPFFISRNYYDEEHHSMNNAFKSSNDSDGSSGSSDDEVLIDIPDGPSEAYFTYWGGSQLPTIGEDEEEYSSLETSEKGPVVIIDSTEEAEIKQISTASITLTTKRANLTNAEDDLLHDIDVALSQKTKRSEANAPQEDDQKTSGGDTSSVDENSSGLRVKSDPSPKSDIGPSSGDQRSEEIKEESARNADGNQPMESDISARDLEAAEDVDFAGGGVEEDVEVNLEDIEFDFEDPDKELDGEADAEEKADGDGAPDDVQGSPSTKAKDAPEQPQPEADAAERGVAVAVDQQSAVTVDRISETEAAAPDKGVDGTMDLAAQLLHGPDDQLKSQHPPSFSRLPPDGHEFPPNYMEPNGHQDLEGQIHKQPDVDVTKHPVKIHKEMAPKTMDAYKFSPKNLADEPAAPPLPKSVPPSMSAKNGEAARNCMGAKNGETTRKLSGDLLLIKSKDEVDEVAKFVPRKLSMGSAEDKPVVNESLKLKNWRKDPKSSCSVRDKIAMFSNTPEPEQPLFPCSPVANFSTTKRLSKTFKSSEDVFNGDDNSTTMSKRLSKSTFSIDKSGITNGFSTAKNIVPVDSCPEKPIQRYCSMEIKEKLAEENNGDVNIYAVNAYSTLPRSATADKLSYNGVLARATSFSGQQATDSQNNMNGTTFAPKLSEEQRKNSLNLLIEQRRRSISKLRGLVIPEKVPEIQSMAPIIDLPEIKSSNSILNNRPRLQTKTPDYTSITPVRISPQLVSPPPWKSPQNNNVPKYSPAFKRKSLQLYKTSDTNGNGVNDVLDSKKTPAKPPRTSLVNGNGYRKSSLGDSPKSLDSAIDNYDYIENNKSTKSILIDSRTDDDSDNDSAVSSSQSSYTSRGYSSPPSPRSALCRTPSSETASSATSTLTSGSCCGSNSSSSLGSGRVLKPQSVEAINRKNILASAKCRSGRDLNGSPLIQRKFDEDSTDGNEEPQLPPPRYSRVKQTTPAAAYSETDSTEPSSLEYVLTQQEATSDSDTEIRKWVRSEAKYAATPAAAVAPPANRGRRSLAEESDSGDLMDMLNGSNAITPPPLVTRSKTDILLKEKRSTSVHDIRKTFEKISPPAPFATNGRSSGKPTGGGQNAGGLVYNHQRISSLDSTTSEGSSGVSSLLANGQNNHSGSSNNLQSGDFGSISSLASSTSVISQQELQQLIDEANSVSEGAGTQAGAGGGSAMALGDALVIVLHRDAPGSSVGITLAGGADYETKEITIHKVLIGSPADRDGRIQKGDRVLSINGKSMKGVTHRESLAILKSPRSEVVMVTSKSKGQGASPSAPTGAKNNRKSSQLQSNIAQSPSDEPKSLSDPNDLTVTLDKQGASLGFSLEGGADSPLGDKPLLIKKIFTGGAADKNDFLRAGDELIKVNDQTVSSLSRVEVWSMMKRLPNGPVEITVRR